MMARQRSQVLPIDWDKDGECDGKQKKAHITGFPDGSVVRITPADAADTGDAGLNPGSERSAGEGSGNPLQYLSWKISWTEEHGGLQFTGSQRARHD